MIYISGQISGLPYVVASTKFRITELELRNLGVKTINPMDQGLKHLKYEDQMEQCFNLIRLHTTGIFLQRDWKQSEGARREFQLVTKLNSKHNRRILIYFEDSDGYSDIRHDIRDGVLKCLYDNYYLQKQ